MDDHHGIAKKKAIHMVSNIMPQASVTLRCHCLTLRNFYLKVEKIRHILQR